MKTFHVSERMAVSLFTGIGLTFALTIPAYSQVLTPQPTSSIGSPIAMNAIELSQVPAQANPGLLTPNPASIPLNDQLKKQEQNVIPAPDQTEVKLDVPEPPTIVELNGTQFHVNKVAVEGNTLVGNKVLGPILVTYQDKELSLNDLGQLVEKINEQYRKRGYLTSIAYIPPQDITQGNITIKVLEGQVGDISIAGNKFYRTGIVARYLDQGSGDPLSIPKLEKNLRRINRQGDFRVRATLSPNTTAGKTDVKLDVEERQPWQVGLTFDDQGRPTIGTLRWGTELINRNVTGIGDRFSARWIGAAGTQGALASYFVPLNRTGTEIGATFGFSRVNVDLPKVRDTNVIIGEALNYGLVLSQPLDREHMFVADASLNFRRITSFLNGNRSSASQDDIRSLQFGLNFDKFDRFGRTFARAQTSFGTTWFGGNRTFWKAETLANRIVRLPKNNYVILRSYAQYTPDALPPAEQFQLGGAYSVRGYTEGLLIGDRGYQFSVEHRWPVPGLRLASPWLADRIQGATFFDYGRTWLDNSNQRSRRTGYTSLAGAGIGVRARLTQYMQGFVDFGFGLADRGNLEPNAQPTARVHFGVRSDLLPDDYRTWGKNVSRVNVKPHYRKDAKRIDAAKATLTLAQPGTPTESAVSSSKPASAAPKKSKKDATLPQQPNLAEKKNISSAKL